MRGAAVVAVFLVSRAYAASFVCPPADDVQKKQAYAVKTGTGSGYLPVLASHPPSTKSYGKGVVVVHGKHQSDQGSYFADLMGQVLGSGVDESMVVVAPGFPDQACSEKTWNGGSESHEALQWSKNTHQWIFGANSDQGGVSTFQALDDVVTWTEKEYKVKEMVVTGFSAGGQMVSRWAIMSAHGEQGKTSSGVPLKIVVGSPSTFAYLDAKRPDLDCSPDQSTGSSHRCANFLVPRKLRCNGSYDEYGYGLAGLQDTPKDAADELVSLHAYLKSTISGHQQYADYIKKRFRSKDFRMMVGTKDEKTCKRGACSGNCASMVQGSNRLQRALNYRDYLEATYPGYKLKFDTFEAGHDSSAFFASTTFHDWVLKDHKKAQGRKLGEESPATHASFVLV